MSFFNFIRFEPPAGDARLHSARARIDLSQFGSMSGTFIDWKHPGLPSLLTDWRRPAEAKHLGHLLRLHDIFHRHHKHHSRRFKSDFLRRRRFGVGS